jgi:hypothetical protein
MAMRVQVVAGFAALRTAAGREDAEGGDGRRVERAQSREGEVGGERGR